MIELPPENQSPFRNDEPVSGSAPWIWVVTCTLAALFLFNTIRAFILGLATKHPIMMLIIWALEVWIVSFAFRAARASNMCKIDRTFGVMADALRAQRRFWIMFVIVGFLTVIGLLAGVLALQREIARLEIASDNIREARPANFPPR